ncbi:hypothetical protein CEY12_03155 [Chryseobacterium sp. T16E-39]|uniref:hypothetical protein n=1 Tax=Chryseobacterium sp. T16E-39 TaxID=2015076 RepID=UPI000B5B481B|nr:hypothetical protein [Chryseobacterium sp. T16E-39]ASK29164.1 hypothetical protein CEY12_03155 [Chryseobacterium sp. T16E-39]
MKIILSLSLLGLLVLSCKKEKENQINTNVDTIAPVDTMAVPPVTSDTMTTAIPPKDSNSTSRGTNMPAASKKDSVAKKK